MKPKLSQIPSGKVVMPKNMVPHLKLAHMFTQLAQKHLGKAMANSPDPANAKLPRPDMAALDTQLGRPLVRRPIIGSPNTAAQAAYE